MSWSRIARRIRVPLGFAIAILSIVLAKPTPLSIVAGVIIILIGLAIRALASGHVRKNEQLTTTGPYAYTRNPLYLGSILMAVGFAVAARSFWLALTLALMFVLVYFPVIHAEEEYLRGHFAEFAGYERNVPRLLPRLSAYGNGSQTFSRELYLQHREYNALAGALVLIAILIVKHCWLTR
jgi:protein-S-isoprenylcysteine O-methyltransferase Ste14